MSAKKPWEETWSADGGYVRVPQGESYNDRDGFFGEKGSWGGSCPCISLEALEGDEARARLAAAAPEMARLLLRLEWSGSRGWEGEHPACPACPGVEPGRLNASSKEIRDQALAEGHAPDCPLVAVLRKAGVR